MLITYIPNIEMISQAKSELPQFPMVWTDHERTFVFMEIFLNDETNKDNFSIPVSKIERPVSRCDSSFVHKAVLAWK